MFRWIVRRRAAVVALALRGPPAHAACAAAVAVTLVVAPAAAQHKDPYKQHMENGIKLFQDKNYPAAITEFRAAYELKPKASPLTNQALCYKAQFNYPKAIQFLERALHDHPDTMDAAERAAAEEAIREMKGLLAYVNVRVTPAAAILAVDDDEIGPNPSGAPIPIGPGKHRVGARLDGFDAQSTEVTVVSGQRDKVIAFALVPNKAWIAVQFPGNLIAIDGKVLGSDKFSGMIPPGQHMLQIYTAGRAGFQVPFNALAGQSVYVTKGPRGTPVVTGGQPVAPVVAPIIAPPPPAKPRVVEPDVPVPQVRGFYLLGGAGLSWQLSHKSLTAADGTTFTFDTNSGFGAQLVGGYRVNNFAGFELLLQYDNVFTPVVGDSDHGYTDSNFRAGPGLRLMTTGKTFRFVGTIAGGIASDTVKLNLPAAQDGTAGQTGSSGGAAAFLLGEVGVELDLSGVLLGVVGQIGAQTTRSLGEGNGSSPAYPAGLGLRIGYAFWKAQTPTPPAAAPAPAPTVSPAK